MLEGQWKHVLQRISSLSWLSSIKPWIYWKVTSLMKMNASARSLQRKDKQCNFSHLLLGFVSCTWYTYFLWCYFKYILCKYDLLNCTRGVWYGIKKWWPWLPYKRLSGIKPKWLSIQKRNHGLSRWNGKLMQGKGSFLPLFFCCLILCIWRWVCGESPVESFSCLADPLWCCLSDRT